MLCHESTILSEDEIVVRRLASTHIDHSFQNPIILPGRRYEKNIIIIIIILAHDLLFRAIFLSYFHSSSSIVDHEEEEEPITV